MDWNKLKSFYEIAISKSISKASAKLNISQSALSRQIQDLELDIKTYSAHSNPRLSHINVGSGVDVSIRQLAETMKQVIGFKGKLKFDSSKPDGPPRKLIDVTKLSNMGWNYQIELEDGLKLTYEWFLSSRKQSDETYS